jgi:hypothetical protein
VRARELTDEEAEQPLGWRYSGEYATYDAQGPLGRDLGFFAVDDASGELVGFGCVGADRDSAARLRMLILRWNGRSRSVAQAHGFRVVGEVGEFDVLVLEPPRKADGEEYRQP